MLGFRHIFKPQNVGSNYKKNDMKFNIGDIVKHYKDSNYSYVILATKKQSLNNSFLENSSGKYNIARIEEIAKCNLEVSLGTDYAISKINNFKEGIAILDEKILYVFENDISI